MSTSPSNVPERNALMTQTPLTPDHRPHQTKARPTGLPFRVAAAATVLATAFAAAGCGSQSTKAAEPDATSGAASKGAAPSVSNSPGPDELPAPGDRERVTRGGIAALVAEHLADKVAGFGYYGGEPGQVDVMVRLRGSDRGDMFGVQMYSPQGGGEFAELAKCPTRKQLKRDTNTKQFTCHKLPSGTTVTAYLDPSGFSDDNAHGHVVSGIAAAADKSVAMVMYESYSKNAPISVTDVDKLLSDPRLTWMTDPAVNAAGKNLKIEKLGS